MQKKYSVHPIFNYVKYQYKNKLYKIQELADMAGITYYTMYQRIKKRKGIITKDILQKEYYVKLRYNYLRYKYKSKLYTIQELANMAGVSYHAMHGRIKKNKGIVTKNIMQK